MAQKTTFPPDSITPEDALPRGGLREASRATGITALREIARLLGRSSATEALLKISANDKPEVTSTVARSSARVRRRAL